MGGDNGRGPYASNFPAGAIPTARSSSIAFGLSSPTVCFPPGVRSSRADEVGLSAATHQASHACGVRRPSRVGVLAASVMPCYASRYAMPGKVASVGQRGVVGRDRLLHEQCVAVAGWNPGVSGEIFQVRAGSRQIDKAGIGYPDIVGTRSVALIRNPTVNPTISTPSGTPTAERGRSDPLAR